MASFNHRVFIFTALPCEAKPLIAHWQLKKDLAAHPYPLYHNDSITLAVAGLGKVAMAGAVAYTLAKFSTQAQPVLINIGIAGQRDGELGGLCLAHKIVDADSGRVFYPPIVPRFNGKSDILTTVSKPHDGYPEPCLYDMEASAFYETAVKFSSSEFIHCLKVISDNAQNPVTAINEAQVMAWIETHCQRISDWLNALQLLRKTVQHNEPEFYQLLTARYHFTVNQAQQLKSLLSRWQVLNNNKPWPQAADEFRNAKQLLAALHQTIEATPFYL